MYLLLVQANKKKLHKSADGVILYKTNKERFFGAGRNSPPAVFRLSVIQTAGKSATRIKRLNRCDSGTDSYSLDGRGNK